MPFYYREHYGLFLTTPMCSCWSSHLSLFILVGIFEQLNVLITVATRVNYAQLKDSLYAVKCW